MRFQRTPIAGLWEITTQPRGDERGRFARLFCAAAFTEIGRPGLQFVQTNLSETPIRGTVRGAPDQASGYASAYLQLLRADPVFLAKFDEIKWGDQGLSRSAQTGRLVLEITLKLKPAPDARKS